MNMQLRKTIKKIASVGAAVGMVGATLMGAAVAADLSEYPYMFISEGSFNGLLVVGSQAKAEDVIGVTLVGTSLQSVSVKTTVVSSGGSDTSDEQVVVYGSEFKELCDRDLYVGHSIADCERQIDDAELPELLGDEVYSDSEGNSDNDERYQQELLFQSNATGTFLFTQDDDDAPTAGTYLFVDDSGATFYNYTLNFDDRVDYDNTTQAITSEDIEGTVLIIQNRPYTITDVKLDTNDGTLDEIEFQVGETEKWLSEGEEITVEIEGTDHVVKLLDVTTDATTNTGACGFQIDGTSVWVEVDDSTRVNGVVVGVIDAKAVHIEAQDSDVCQVVLGAKEIRIVDGDEIEVNDEDIDGTLGRLTFANQAGTSASEGRWSGFEVSWTPEFNEVYLADGDEYVDPVFGSMKLVFGGVETGGVEKLEWVTGSTSGYLRFTNEDGREVEIPLAADQNSPDYDDVEIVNEEVFIGDDAPTATDFHEDKLVYLDEEVCSGSNTDVQNCVGAMFLVVTANELEAHLLEITNIDENDNQISFRDLTYGTEDKDMSYTNGVASTIQLSAGVGNIQLIVSEEPGTINFTSIGSVHGVNIQTRQEAILTIVNLNISNQTYEGWNFSEGVDGDLPTGDYLINFTIFSTYDDRDDNSIEFNHTTLTSTQGYGFADESSDNDDFQKFYTKKGSLITFDRQDKQSLVIEHPHDAVYAKVYVAPTEAETVEVAAEGSVSETVQQISVNAVKLDNEVTDAKAMNIVAVGGPCANAVVAELMGNPAQCETALGISSGQALIKLFENGEYVALVVAGQDAMDTRLASQILANWDDYELSGDEMIATTVSESSLSVTAR